MNRDQWNNVFEFVKAFGDFDDHGAYDPDGGIFQNLKKNLETPLRKISIKPKLNRFEIFYKPGLS